MSYSGVPAVSGRDSSDKHDLHRGRMTDVYADESMREDGKPNFAAIRPLLLLCRIIATGLFERKPKEHGARDEI